MEHRKIFDEVSKMLYVWVNGEITLAGMIKLHEEIISENALPSKLKILELGSGDKSKLKTGDIELLVNSMNSKTSSFESVKHAIVELNPIYTAQSMLAELYADRNHYVIKVFSTESAAKNWLMMQ
jgi:hypothetical protein